MEEKKRKEKKAQKRGERGHLVPPFHAIRTSKSKPNSFLDVVLDGKTKWQSGVRKLRIKKNGRKVYYECTPPQRKITSHIQASHGASHEGRARAKAKKQQNQKKKKKRKKVQSPPLGFP